MWRVPHHHELSGSQCRGEAHGVGFLGWPCAVAICGRTSSWMTDKSDCDLKEARHQVTVTLTPLRSKTMALRQLNVLSLPNEVLTDILVVGYCAKFSLSCKAAMLYVITVSQVCALFRTLVQNAPVFWRAICLDEWRDLQFPITRMFLELSMHKGLTLAWNDLGKRKPRPATVSAKFELITRHAIRWEELTIHTMHTPLVLKLFHQLPPHLPKLKILEIHSRHAVSRGWGHPPPLLQLPSLPSLTSLCLYLPFEAFPPHLCSSQTLTSVTITLPEVHNPGATIPSDILLVFEMIGRLVSLVSLELAGSLGFFRYHL